MAEDEDSTKRARAGEGWYQRLQGAVKQLKREVLALYYAAQDPDVGFLPRAITIFIIACASPLRRNMASFQPANGWGMQVNVR